MNILTDEAFDNAWRMIHDKDRKMHKKIDINKYLEIDRYVDKYTDIVNGKIELLNNIGVILDSAMIEIQSKVDMINDVKQKENIDIETLKLIHKTLDKIFKKWMSITSKAFENDIFSKYDVKPNKPDTKKRHTSSKPNKPDKPDKLDKPDKPDTKKDTKPDTKEDTKPDTKPDTKTKDTNPDTKTKDTKPDTRKKDTRPDTKKKNTKPDTKKKDKPDTEKKDKPDTKTDTKKKDKADTKPDTKKKDKPDTKPDTKKKDKPDTKPNAKKKDKPDNNKKDKPDTKKKDRPNTKKKDKPDTKPDTKKKDKPDTKPDTNKKDKPDTNKEDKPDTKKKDRPNTKKKDKPDTKIDIKKHKEILKKMIITHVRMLLPLNTLLLNLIECTYWEENYASFCDLCKEKRLKIDAKAEDIIADIYSINVVLDCIRDGLKCKAWPKCIGISCRNWKT